MGRLVKNTLFESGNYALGLAAQNASFRPNVAGFTSQTALRYSTTSDKLEYYAHSGNVWQTVSNVGAGTSRITKDHLQHRYQEQVQNLAQWHLLIIQVGKPMF